ncbi:MAG: hypothetical protein M3R32_00555 [Chloroflexota bacterium]|nr:hypothetical protein [Chloroflexota bacterium]
MRRRLSFVVVVAILALVSAATVLAVTTLPIRVAVVNKVDIDRNGIDFETERKVDVITTFSSQPSTWAGSGWHYHNGPVFVSVTMGTLTFWTSTCRKIQITAGQGYIESAGQILLAKNLDSTTVAEWYTSRVIPYQTNGTPGLDPVPVVHADCP